MKMVSIILQVWMKWPNGSLLEVQPNIARMHLDGAGAIQMLQGNVLLKILELDGQNFSAYHISTQFGF
jgi:hypothetical protein